MAIFVKGRSLRSVRKREMGYHPPITGLKRYGTEVRMSIALTATVKDDDVMVVCTELEQNLSAAVR
jgi:hypothetical protein